MIYRTRAVATFVAVLALAATQAPASQVKARIGTPFDARVVLVADGDTLELIPAGESERIRIRLEGIDAPELGEPFSGQARTLTRTLLFRQRVRVEGRDVDRYNRLVARVTVSGQDASLALVQAGLACHLTQFANDPILADAQSRARTAGTGFWAANAQKPRCTRGGRRAPRRPRAHAHQAHLTLIADELIAGFVQ